MNMQQRQAMKKRAIRTISRAMLTAIAIFGLLMVIGLMAGCTTTQRADWRWFLDYDKKECCCERR